MRVSYPGEKIVFDCTTVKDHPGGYTFGKPTLLPTDYSDEQLEGETWFDSLEILSIELNHSHGWVRVLTKEPIEGITTFYMPKDGLQLRPSIAFEEEHVEPFVYKDETGRLFNGYRVKNQRAKPGSDTSKI